jgi:hypothetical protein
MLYDIIVNAKKNIYIYKKGEPNFMKTKKFLAAVLTLAMLASMASVFHLSAAAADGELAFELPDISEIVPMPMPTFPVIPQDSDYAFIEGTVNEIRDFIDARGETSETKCILNIVNGESEWNAVVDENTFFIGEAVEAGDNVKVFFNAKAPAIMIYPPQLNAEFLAVNLDEATFVAIARFDSDFVSVKNSLKLNISEDTEIVYESGDKFEGEIAELVNPSRKLVVLYSITTRSIPAITTPEKIIIMYEKAVAPIYILTDEEKAEIARAFEKADIVINGEVIEAPRAFLNENGTLMVPVRAIAEALGFPFTPVLWLGDSATVQIGAILSFSIGQDAYSFARMAPVSFGTAPVIKDDRTYVPIDLFGLPLPSELGSINWHLANGQIHIEIRPNIPETDITDLLGIEETEEE